MRTFLICLVLGCFAHADQVNCVKWKDSSGNTVGTYCRPFSVAAGTGIHFSDNGQGVITITGTSTIPGAGGSDTQVNFNSSGALSGSSGLTWNNSTSTLTATHVTGLDNKPYYDMVRDCGAVGNGITDDGAAIQACFDAHPRAGFFFPKTVTSGCSYLSNQTLYPRGSGVQVIGQSGAQYLDGITAAHMGGTEICFPTGITGLWLDLNSNSTEGGAIRSIVLRGTAGITSLLTPTAINLSSDLPQFTRTITSIQRAANVLTITVAAAGSAEGLTQQVGSTVKISGVVGDTTMNGNCIVATLVAGAGTSTNPRTLTCPQNGSDTGPFTNDGSLLVPSTGASTADGIRICSNFWTIDHVGIVNFERHGINADSRSGHGCALPFSDDIQLHDSMMMENGGDGFYCQGTDCNAGYMSGNTFYYNFLYGVEDQSSLGNTHAGEQASNNGHSWATTTTPATKTISTIARTLTSGISQVSVVLSVADTNIKLGSCVVIAGVTDTSFNTTSGQCFFVNSFTDSKHYGYEQPGAPADASSSSGTSRMAKFAEVYLSSGVDDGAVKFGTQTGVWSSAIFSNYIEGGQNCKYGSTVLNISGANSLSCLATQDWIGAFISTNGTNAGKATNISNFTNEFDGNYTISYRSGKTSDFNITTQWKDHSNTTGWSTIVTPASGGSFQFFDRSSNRRSYYDATTVRINSESTGSVEINNDGSSGTGGLKVCDGAASPACITLNSATASTVGAAGAASALPANPTGYLIFKVGSTNFKIPYYAN